MIDIGKYLQSSFEDGYYKGKSEAEENAVKEINRLKAERDAAVAELAVLGFCDQCKHYAFCQCDGNRTKCADTNDWEWRGVQDGY